MTFADLPANASVFVDADVLVFHFHAHSAFGPVCTDLVERVERQEFLGFTSTHVVSEMAHRLMTLEACAQFGWPFRGIAQRIRQHPAQVKQLTRFRQAIQSIARYRIQVLTIPSNLIDAAAGVSQQTGLLSNDALIVALMQANNLTNLVSNDADFDRVPGITRFAPK